MKYLILLLDGAADEPIEELGGKTALEFANIKNINKLASIGEIGKVFTVEPDILPSSDAANLAIMGYDPLVYMTGRAPLEAVSMGIIMSEYDMAFRAGMVTLLDPNTGKNADEKTATAYEDLIIADYSASLITDKEASILINELSENLVEGEGIEFYPGVSYRNCMIFRGLTQMDSMASNCKLNTPQDNIGEKVKKCLPKSERLVNIQKYSYEIMRKNEVNKNRIAKGLNPANSIWLWGRGKKTVLPNFEKKYGISASVISAVDLIKGIGISAGMKIHEVSGADGTLNTNYEGKCRAAIDEYKNGTDLVYLHLEGPDECGHQGDVRGKVLCLERIDEKILKPLLEYFETENSDFKILILPDHKTPVKKRVHTKGAVPFLIYESTNEKPCDLNRKFNEKISESGKIIKNGYEIMDYFLGNNF